MATNQTSSSSSTAYSYLPQEKITAADNLNHFLDNPLANLHDILGPLLNDPSLVQSENKARTNLQDEFRKAGVLNSDIYGSQVRQQENDILSNRYAQAAKAGLQYLAPLISGRASALSGIPALERRESSTESGPAAGSSFGYGPHGNGSFLDQPFTDLGPSGDPFRSYAPGGITSGGTNSYVSGYNPTNPTPTLDDALDRNSGAGLRGTIPGSSDSNPQFFNYTDPRSQPGFVNFQTVPKDSPYNFFGEE